MLVKYHNAPGQFSATELVQMVQNTHNALVKCISNNVKRTHLPVSVADGFGERTPSLSVFHLYWCIMGQQEMSTFWKKTKKNSNVNSVPLFKKNKNKKREQ